jgi:hypothetical protein
MRAEHATWQLGRYLSGMNTVIAGDQFSNEFGQFTEREVIDALWNRMRFVPGGAK